MKVCDELDQYQELVNNSAFAANFSDSFISEKFVTTLAMLNANSGHAVCTPFVLKKLNVATRSGHINRHAERCAERGPSAESAEDPGK